MGITIVDKYIKSNDGIHTLKGVMYIPEEIKGVVMIVHGMCEHIGRYDSFMNWICERGYVAVGYNHVGHAGVSEKEERGFFSEEGGDELLVNDVVLCANAVKEEYPKEKFILFGHSMGSFIVRLAAPILNDKIDGLIVMGTGGPNKASRAGITLTNTLIKCGKGRKVSNLVYFMAFGKYNGRTDNETVYDWLTHDKDIISAHLEDEDCKFKFTTSAMRDLILLNYKSNKKECLCSYRDDLPILLISGDEDPVGDYGVGVKSVYESLIKLNKKVSIKIYPGMRHEVLNEYGRDHVYDYLINYIEEI